MLQFQGTCTARGAPGEARLRVVLTPSGSPMSTEGFGALAYLLVSEDARMELVDSAERIAARFD